MAPKLISRKTVEEHFVADDEDERLEEANDIEGGDEPEENADEPSPASRPRRRRE